MYRLAGIFLAFSVLCGSTWSPAFAQDKSLTVFAAASMKNALDDVDAAYTAKTGVKVMASYAASSTLAKQIEQGAPADIFVSADTDWMDYATSKKTINEPTRVNLLGNSIVLIAPKDSKIGHVAIGKGFDLAKLAGDGKIATGDVKAVPVGKYAKAALEKCRVGGRGLAAEPLQRGGADEARGGEHSRRGSCAQRANRPAALGSPPTSCSGDLKPPGGLEGRSSLNTCGQARAGFSHVGLAVLPDAAAAGFGQGSGKGPGEARVTDRGVNR